MPAVAIQNPPWEASTIVQITSSAAAPVSTTKVPQSKGYDFIIEDERTQRFLDRREFPIAGGWKAEIALGFKGYCPNCMEGNSKPLTEREREEFLEGLLGEHEVWEKERKNREKLMVEQERLMARLKKEKRESEGWTEVD
jgi:hypothetical protein